jgi:hypothetical protein
VVGDVVLGALPTIETHLSKTLVLTGHRVGARRSYKMMRARATAPRQRRHPRRSLITAVTDAH